MNKRAIVNVATGEFYCKMQERLNQSFTKSVNGTYYFDKWGGGRNENAEYDPSKPDLILWTDVLPKGSRPHSESPYGFKVHAIRAAYEMGYTSILWLDSPAYAVKEDISPIFDKIEKEGYYAMSHIDPLENWVGKRLLDTLHIDRSLLNGLNLPSGSCYGFDLNNPTGKMLFEKLESAELLGFFESEQIKEGSWHRHDEAVLAILLYQIRLQCFTFDPLFQSDSPKCVIKSGG